MTTDIRKALGEKARIERDKATAKEEAARKALLEVCQDTLAECACLYPSLSVHTCSHVRKWHAAVRPPGCNADVSSQRFCRHAFTAAHVDLTVAWCR